MHIDIPHVTEITKACIEIYNEKSRSIDKDKNLTVYYEPTKHGLKVSFNWITELSHKSSVEHNRAENCITITEADTLRAYMCDVEFLLIDIDNHLIIK